MSSGQNQRNIVLIGFMGAGKSTVGSRLARFLGYRLVDLDRLIVERAGCSIREIFARDGEAVFRAYEAAALRALVGMRRIVVATGGGIVGRRENWLAMHQLGIIAYLRVPWEVLCERIAGDEKRPLADQRDGGERLRQLWESRLPLYEQADLIVECDRKSPEQIARWITAALERA